MSNVELVMEVGSGLTEVLFDFTVKSQGSLDNGDDLLLNGSLELCEMLAHKGVIDGEQGGLFGEGNSQCPEVSLKAGVDLERTSSGVHAGSIQGVFNVLEGQLGLIIPMIVVLMLSQERDGSLSVVGIKRGHVKIVDEIDQLEFADGGIRATSFLLELGLEHILQKS